MKIFILIGVAFLSGCAQTPQAPVSSLESFDLCYRAIAGSRYYSSSELMGELRVRGEDCKSYMPMIQAKIQADAQASNSQRALGMQLLQAGQAKPATLAPNPFGNSVNCQTRYNNGVAYTNCN